MEYQLIKQPRVVPNHPTYQVAKRLLDLSLCILGAPIIIPVMCLCAIAIWLDSAGPVLFVQDRIGKGGHKFQIYKFRTMPANWNDSQCRVYMKSYVRGTVIDGENKSGRFKPTHTQQITRVGRILRKASLDELPQLINVLKGEMSIVGPRPNVLWEVEEYQPWHHERFEVLPGITGLAQVRGRSDINFTSLVRYDIEYIEKQSLILDIKILWWTVLTAIQQSGAR